jgi:hypothetical protein
MPQTHVPASQLAWKPYVSCWQAEYSPALCVHACRRPRTVIVAVIQASVDALTQEAFKLAREVDPEKVSASM